MKLSIMSLLVGLGSILFGFGPGFAADDARKIPLDLVYTTTRQKDTKDALPHLRGFPKPNFSGNLLPGKPVIFMVNGKDFPAALRASRRFVLPEADTKAPQLQAGEPSWVCAYLGSTGSIPPAYRVQSVEIDGTKVRITYKTLARSSSSLDYFSYFVWAPLGKLPAGDYTLELYDAAAKQVTATRKSKVLKE